MQLFLERFAFPGWRYAFVAFILVVFGGYFFFGRPAQLGATLAITPGDFKKEVRVSGTVIAAQDVNLGFAANGRISSVSVKVGQRVAAGTLLAQVENGDVVATIAQKQAALASLQTGTRPEELAIAAATVASTQAKLIDAITAAYTTSDDAVHNKMDTFFSNPRTDPKLSFVVGNTLLKATVEQERVVMEPMLANWTLLVSKLSAENAADSAVQAQAYLAQVLTLLVDANAAINQGLPGGTTSSATLSSYATTLATARTNVNDAAKALTNAQSALTDAQKTLALDQAGSTASDIAAAQAEVQNAQAAFAKTRVVAPFSGIITRMDAKVGEIVSPTDSLISLQSNGVFQVEAFVPEVTIAGVIVGNPATTTLDAYGSLEAFPAIVVAVDPAETVKDGVPTYKTTLSFLAADARIRSGMTANVTIETGVLQDAIVIPAGAVGTKEGASFVSVVEGDTIVNRKVTTGPAPALGQAHILSGLSAGEVIALTPTP